MRQLLQTSLDGENKSVSQVSRKEAIATLVPASVLLLCSAGRKFGAGSEAEDSGAGKSLGSVLELPVLENGGRERGRGG